MRKTIFISDLHLQADAPTITRLFLNFCAQDPAEIDAIYILGDLFEAWVGDDLLDYFNTKIITTIRELTQQNIPVFFIHGNRDFLIGERFAKACNCTLLTEEEVIEVYGEKILIMHGDSLCTTDKRYLKMRKLFRNKFIQFLFLSLPLSFRQSIAKKLRAKSKAHTTSTPLEMMDVNLETVQAKMQAHQVEVLIHGHTHQPAIHKKEDKTRIVLGAWHSFGNMLICQQNGEKVLKDFTCI